MARTAASSRDGASSELVRLYEADQRERTVGGFAGGDTSVAAICAQMARDAARLARVRALVAAGRARTATDYFAAAMVAQHGEDTTAYRQAAAWARQAAALDSADRPAPADTLAQRARRLAAAAHDRYLRALGRPQCYGTQLGKNPISAPYVLEPVDPACATPAYDAERRRLGLRTLAEMRALVDSLNTAAPARP